MSSAFDTLDHNILLHRLSPIGINCTALRWFESYITNLLSFICISKHISPHRKITHGFLEGSVLGTILFNIYLLPIFEIFDKYPDINFHSYADDLQIYLICTDSPTYCPDRISNCISDLLKWLNSNSLKFNPNKTESIFLNLTLCSNTLPNPPPVTLGNIVI